MNKSNFKQSQSEAEEALQDEGRMDDLLRNAGEKAKKHARNLKSVWEDLQSLIRMLLAYRRGTYRQLPWKTLLSATAAVIYFVNPLDLIPDFFGLIGFVDDAAVITWVVNSLRDDLERFRLFSQGRPEPRDVAVEEVE